MSKRTSASLSQPTKAKKRREMTISQTIFVGGEPTAPNSEEWEDDSRMYSIGHFQIVGANNEPSIFKPRDYAIILPENKSVSDKANMCIGHYWTGKIRDIRVRKSNPEEEVWVKVQWLYDPSEVAAVLKRFKKGFAMGEYGRMERILSNHFDFVHSTCFEDHITVLEYEEDAERPKAIHSEDHLFYRAKFDATKSVLELGLNKSCLCKVPYDPDAERTVMHFCVNCLLSFHAACLRKNKSQDAETVESCYPSERQMKMEVSFAPKEADVSAPEMPTAHNPSNKQSDSEFVGEDSIDELWMRYDLLPAELVVLARSPMVKGKGTQIPALWTVSGNIAIVSRAREIVNDVVRHKRDLPEKWEHVLAIPGSSGGSPSNLLAWVVDDHGFRCPRCNYPI